PNLEQYRKLAQDLVNACTSGDRPAIGAWADRWIASLLAASNRQSRDRAANQVEEFAIRAMTAGKRTCVLADAQFVIARAHGFESWPKFSAHLDVLTRAGGDAPFEAAAQAIVDGDEETLRRLPRERPDLIRARSEREHHATLLHYVSANGVEGYRQKTPQNIVRITEILLEAGAEVEAEANGAGVGRLDVVQSRFDRARVPELEMAMRYAAAYGHGNVVTFMLDRGVEVDAHTGDGETALFYAVLSGHLDVIQLLLARGARPGVR